MKLISLHITEKQEEWIQLLINSKYYPNRSECIRNFINDGIKHITNIVLAKTKLSEKLEKIEKLK